MDSAAFALRVKAALIARPNVGGVKIPGMNAGAIIGRGYATWTSLSETRIRVSERRGHVLSCGGS